jgi:cobalt-zinc-cadmium efflux system outer membrane protein
MPRPPAIVLLWIAAAGLRAAEPLTLEKALALADQNHPQLRVSAAVVDRARAGIVTARAYPNPEGGWLAGGQHARMAGVASGVAQIFSAEQPLETRQVRRTRLEAASIGKEGAEWSMAETRLVIRAAVKQNFFQVLRRKGEIAWAEENLRLVEDLKRRVQVQVEVGEAARVELVRAEAEVAMARTLARSAQLRLVTALAGLRTAMGAAPELEFDPAGTLDPPAQLPSLEQLRKETLETYPGFAQARAGIRQAEAQVRNEVALRRPQPSVASEWEVQPDVSIYRFGVRIPLMVWNKRQGPIAEAEASVRQARAAAESRRVEILGALESAYGRYQVASQQAAAFEEGVLRQAESAVQAAEAAFRFGERGILEVLDAQRVLRSARLDYLNAQFDRQAALIEVEQLRASEAGKVKP